LKLEIDIRSKARPFLNKVHSTGITRFVLSAKRIPLRKLCQGKEKAFPEIASWHAIHCLLSHCQRKN
jgi:hypothetical protein